MRDENGLFYYPFPQNKRVRMYVKEENGGIWFRLWSLDDAKLWEDHGWVPHGAVRKATKLFKGKADGAKPAAKSAFDPEKAYDIEVARLILKEGK